jgi:thioesterase domain-containing protein
VPEIQDGDQDAEIVRVCSHLEVVYGLNFNLDIEQLRQVPKNERREFLYNVITRGGYVITKNQYDVNYDVIMASDDSCRNYRTPKLSHKIDDVTLYRANDVYLDGMPYDNGWNKFLLNPIRIFNIEANHFTLVNEGPVQEIAKNIILSTETKNSEPHMHAR